MPNRRQFISSAAIAGLGLVTAAFVSALPFARPALAGYEPPEGFHHQDWFQTPTFDLRKDLMAANESGKMLVLLWEQKGCEYCKAMHEIAFSYDEITDLAKANFYVVQMDMRGKREFLDFNGNKKTEAAIAKASRVTFTPTTQFLETDGSEEYRMPGYAKPPVFLAVYQYVLEKGYRRLSFRDWVKEKVGG